MLLNIPENFLYTIDYKCIIFLLYMLVEKNQVLTRRVKELEEERMTSYDGTLLWKIPGVAQRRRNARLGPVPYIESPVFYTNRQTKHTP